MCRVVIPLLYIPFFLGKTTKFQKKKLQHFHSIPLFCVKFVSGEDQGPSWGLYWEWGLHVCIELSTGPKFQQQPPFWALFEFPTWYKALDVQDPTSHNSPWKSAIQGKV